VVIAQTLRLSVHTIKHLALVTTTELALPTYKSFVFIDKATVIAFVKPNYSKVIGYRINPIDSAQGSDNSLINKDLGLIDDEH
jgi:hypothetical protein